MCDWETYLIWMYTFAWELYTMLTINWLNYNIDDQMMLT